MSVTYSPAPAVERVATKLIPKHHQHLVGVEVRYVHRSECAKKQGQVVLGKARKVSGLNAWLVSHASLAGLKATVKVNVGPEVPMQSYADGDPFFVIEIPVDIWENLLPREKEALVDHELSHCGIKVNKKDEVQLYIVPHDLEEFGDVVRRWGVWQPNVAAFLKAAKAGQPTLWEELTEEDDDGASITTISGDREATVG